MYLTVSLMHTVKIKINQDIVYSNILLYCIILLYIQFLLVTILHLTYHAFLVAVETGEMEGGVVVDINCVNVTVEF